MLFSFADCTLDVERRELRRGSEPVAVEPQVFDLLIFLIRNRDRVVSKDELIASVWGGRIVSDSTLTSRIYAARKAIGDSAEEQRLIRTVARKGIRFVAEVRETAEPAPAATTSNAAMPALAPPGSNGPAAPAAAPDQAAASLGERAGAQDHRPSSDKPSIAVLPFANMSGDPEQEYFADGVAEDIITELSRMSAFFVMARNSSFAYRGRALDAKEVGRELGVRYIVEGSVRRAGDRVRLTANLIETETGKNIWAEKYDRNVAEIFSVQDEITAGLVASMQTQVLLNEGVAAERQNRPDLAVWDRAKRGLWEIYQLTPASLERALAIGREIVHLDPTSSKGHQLVALASYHLVIMGFTNQADALREEAAGAAREAVRYDSADEYSQWALGMVLGNLLGRYEEAVSAYLEGLRINPNFSLGYATLGSTSGYACRPEEAIANTEIAMRLNPRDPSLFFRYSTLALAYFVLGDFVTAQDWAQRTVSSKPEWWLGHALLAASRAHLDDAAGAREAGAELMRRFPKLSINSLPFRALHDPHHLEVLRAGLCKAGLSVPADLPSIGADSRDASVEDDRELHHTEVSVAVHREQPADEGQVIGSGQAYDGAAGKSEDDLILPGARRRAIAVMPFVDRSDIGGVRGGAAGALVYDVITRLAKLRSLFVIAQGTVFALHERGLGPEEAGRVLEVDYVASGSLRRSARRLTVEVELTEARTARIVWSESFDRTLDDAFVVLDEIGDSIVALIASEIETLERNRAILKPPNSLDAWEAHHRGLWHMYRFNDADNEQARHFFEMALRLDPTFSRAHAGLSFTHFQNAFQGWAERGPEIERAYAAAGQSLMADDRDPAAHLAMGRALWLRGLDEQSLFELKRSVDLSPNFALAHYNLAFVHSQAGDPESAIASADHSRQLSPFDPMLFAMLGARANALVRLGRFEEAADWAVNAAARPNAHAHNLAVAAFSLALADRLDEARAHLARIHRTQPDYRVDDFLTAMRFPPDAEQLFRKGAKRIGLA